MQHHLIPAPVRLFGNFAGVRLVRKDGNRQRIGEPEQCVRLRAVVPKIIDHDGKPRASRRRGRSLRFWQRRNEVDRLRPPAIQQVIEALQAGRSRARDALQVVKLRDARQFRFDRIVRGPVRRARFGGRHGDVNVIGDERLLLARLARSVFGTHAHFGAPAAGVSRGKHKFTRDVPDPHVGRGRGFFLAARREK